MFGFLKKLFGRESAEEALDRLGDEYAWMMPPDDLHDPEAWDRYWRDQLEHDTLLSDMFVDDGDLVDAMRAHDLKSVLCVGCGLSMEPHALVKMGFHVTVLDLSPMVANMVREVGADLEGEDIDLSPPGGRSGRARRRGPRRVRRRSDRSVALSGAVRRGDRAEDAPALPGNGERACDSGRG